MGSAGKVALLLAAATAPGASALAVPSRRQWLVGGTASALAGPAVASDEFSTGTTGLLLLPPVAPLRNRYHWVRAGEDAMEAQGVITTNSAFKLAVSNSLTERGAAQARAAAADLRRAGVESTGPACTRTAPPRGTTSTWSAA